MRPLLIRAWPRDLSAFASCSPAGDLVGFRVEQVTDLPVQRMVHQHGGEVVEEVGGVLDGEQRRVVQVVEQPEQGAHAGVEVCQRRPRPQGTYLLTGVQCFVPLDDQPARGAASDDG